jgi:hypothetical protein
MNNSIKAINLCSIIIVSTSLAGCIATPEHHESNTADAITFIETTERKRIKASHTLELAWYISQRFANTDTINHRNNLMNEYQNVLTEGVYESLKFKDVKLDEEMSFRLNRISTGTQNPIPENPDKADRLSKLSAKLNVQHSKGAYCKKNEEANNCPSLTDMNAKMKSSNVHNELHQIWQERQNLVKTMKTDFKEKV